MNRLLQKRKTGFTLVEILVVILIIGLLFVFLVPKIDSATDKARETGIKTDFRSYQTAFEAVAREHGGLGENAITDDSKAIQLINGYLDPALKITTTRDLVSGNGYITSKLDPWNNPYVFRYSANTNNNGYVIIRTFGKDGRNTFSDMHQSPNMYAKARSYKLDASGMVINAEDGCLDADLERARVFGRYDSDKIDDYVLCTWYIDGQIFTATAGFTTNIESGVLGTN